ncbi:MAG: DNA gyrase inhibitor YacG [Steroidobacteraceae bacterium]|nr:DNA gyrase inhibitor YacG [Steroidobacteraceae bacterium]
MPTVVPCPTCQRPVKWSEASPFRPFCSDRCKLIDLGAWIAEKHVIPGEEISSTANEDDGSGERPLNA